MQILVSKNAVFVDYLAKCVKFYTLTHKRERPRKTRRRPLKIDPKGPN